MFHVVRSCFCLPGKWPRHRPLLRVPADQPPADVQRQREWLLAHFIVDMQAQGKFDARKYQEIETMLKGMTASQVGVLVQDYQQRKTQVAASREVQANAELRRLESPPRSPETGT